MQKDMQRERERGQIQSYSKKFNFFNIFFYQEEQIKKREEKLSDAPLPFLNIVN